MCAVEHVGGFSPVLFGKWIQSQNNVWLPALREGEKLMMHFQLLVLKCKNSWAVFRPEVPQLLAGGRKKGEAALERPRAVPGLLSKLQSPASPPCLLAITLSAQLLPGSQSHHWWSQYGREDCLFGQPELLAVCGFSIYSEQ